MPAAYGARVQRLMPFLLLGGITGAAARWTVGELLSSPTSTLLVVNTAGSFILGLATVIGHTDAGRPLHLSPVRLGLTVGFCGGLTTFSALAVDVADRLRDGSGAALGLALASVLAGIAALLLGRSIGRQLNTATS